MELAKTTKVELMIHAREPKEYKYLLSDSHLEMLQNLEIGGLFAGLTWSHRNHV